MRSVQRPFLGVTKFDLRLMDCLTGMAKLPNESIDLVVTSPPYNLGIRYGKFRDKDDRQSYLRWCRQWAGQICRIVKPSGSFFLNVGSAPSNPMLPHQMVTILCQPEFDGFKRSSSRAAAGR